MSAGSTSVTGTASPWHPPPVADDSISASDARSTNPITCVAAVLPSQEDVDKFLDDYYGDRKMEEPKGPFNLILTTVRHEKSESGSGDCKEDDPPLTARGEEFAKGGAVRTIDEEVPDLTFTSPLKRTMETAKIRAMMHYARLAGSNSKYSIAVFDPLRETGWKDCSTVTTAKTDFEHPRLTSAHVHTESPLDSTWTDARVGETGSRKGRVQKVCEGRVASTLKLLGYIGKGIHLRTDKSHVGIECISHEGFLTCLYASLEDSPAENATKGRKYFPNYPVEFGQTRSFTCRCAPESDTSWGFEVTNRAMVDPGSEWVFGEGAENYDKLLAGFKAVANEASKVNTEGPSDSFDSDAADTARSGQESD